MSRIKAKFKKAKTLKNPLVERGGIRFNVK